MLDSGERIYVSCKELCNIGVDWEITDLSIGLYSNGIVSVLKRLLNAECMWNTTGDSSTCERKKFDFTLTEHPEIGEYYTLSNKKKN